MRITATNATAVGLCLMFTSLGYGAEEFSSEPVDVTPQAAKYAAGTFTVQAADGYIAAPPNAPVDGGITLRELRLDGA